MSGHRLKVAFAGTPEFAARALTAIINAGYPVPLVLSQPDRPAGRGMKWVASPVKQVALTHGIALDQPEKLRSEAQRAALVASVPDVLVVAAYGLLLPREVLSLPRLGCINIHASLLPRWRGAAPIHRAIEAGDAESGITIMQMDEGLDTGPMLLRRALAIEPDETTASLHDRLAALGASLIVEALDKLPGNGLAPQPQADEGVTYAAKISKAEAAIDWCRPADEIERRLRAFDPFPGAVTRMGTTQVKVWRAVLEHAEGEAGTVLAVDDHGILVACGEQALRLTLLQKPGSRRLAVGEFLRGFPVRVGERFGEAV